MWDRTEVFQYFDGEKAVWGDPLEIHEALAAHLDGDVNAVLKNAKSEDRSVSLAAFNKLVPAVREAFRLMPFNPETGEGTTWKVCLEVLKAFVAWEEALKKNGAGSPTSYFDAAASTPEESPTSTSWDSGSTSNGPTGETPET